MSRADIPFGCRPFNLEAAQGGAPLRTRDGKPAQLIYVKPGRAVEYPVIALVEDRPYSFSRAGLSVLRMTSSRDLFISDPASKGMTEFEDRLANIIQAAVNLSDRSELTMDHVRSCAAELMEIARKQFDKEAKED